jgi:hypothetical protein
MDSFFWLIFSFEGDSKEKFSLTLSQVKNKQLLQQMLKGQLLSELRLQSPEVSQGFTHEDVFLSKQGKNETKAGATVIRLRYKVKSSVSCFISGLR